jgi:DNA-binding FadR family transcriptional regulator
MPKATAARVLPFRALQKQPLSDGVYRQLHGRILRRELTPGDELPAERALAEQLQVNRGAVREALKRLQQAGLIAVNQGGNSVVLDYLDEGGLELLPSLLLDTRGRLNSAVVRSIMAMRSALAPDIAAAAARKNNLKTATELEALLEQMRACESDLTALQKLALEFWRKLVERGGNIAFRLAFNSMTKTYTQVWGTLTQVLAPEFRDFDNLSQIAAAVRAGNEDQARRAARRHIEIGRLALERALGVETGGEMP